MTNIKSPAPVAITVSRHINEVEWAQANDRARHICARVFRDGGAPSDALVSHGVSENCDANDWGRAVDLIAQAICAQAPVNRRAA